MINNKHSLIRISGLILVLVLTLTTLVGIAGASRTASSSQAPLSAPQAAIDNAASCDDSTPGILDCVLYATTGSLTMPDGATVDIWGYSDISGGTAQLPGPTIIASEGDSVTITLHNNLGDDTALLFPGQSMIPDLGGVAPGGSTTYTFIASSPGTYLYEAGLLPDAARQVAMGLFGALVVRPASGANHAYDASSIFVDEALLVLSEIDPALNANPTAFDMRDFSPEYRLINGLAYPDTAEISTAAGSIVLLRYVNAGIQQHTMGVLGMDQLVIARDANIRPYAQRVLNESIGPGRTADTIVTVPAAPPLGTTHYALYDASLLLHNNGAAFGGMLTFLTLTDGTPPATGPTTDTVTLAPNPTDGSEDVTLSATISGVLNITAAEYFVDTQGADGTGIAMSAVDVFDSPTEAVTAQITVADLNLLSSGDHTFYVHGFDGTTWGAFNFATLSLDKLGPATSGVTLAPNPSDGSAAVAVSATGNDTATGNSDVTAAEYFIGNPGTDGDGIDMSVNVTAPIASLDGSIASGLAQGAYTISVHSMDSFGQWGDYATTTLMVDQTGPDTSNVEADPNPNNGSTPYSPTVFAVRVDATLSDPITLDVNSTIQRAEGYIENNNDAVNNDPGIGFGFPLSPRDGLFNESVEDAYVYIPLSTIGQLGAGTHQIYVRAQDASGNWGEPVFVGFVIETDIPTVTNVLVTPITTDGTVLVALTANASDPSTDIVLAEWFAGADPGTGNGTSMTVTANGAVWDLAATIDASGWAAGDYTISVRARDAAGNWSAPDPTDPLDPNNFAFATLTVTEGPPAEPTTLYFSTAGSAAIPGVPGPNDDADVYLWDATLFSRVFDGSAQGGLPGNTDIDGLAFDGGLFYLSFNRNGGTNVPGVGAVQDEDVVTYNPGDLQWELAFAGVDVCDGMDASNGHDIDAFDVVGGVIYFSTEGDASIAGQAGPFDDADIYIVPGCSRIFDATFRGLPGNANIDGLTVVDVNTIYMSFDQDGIDVPGIGIVQDEDVVLYEYDAGTQVAVWSLYFDGSLQGFTSKNHDLDAIDVQ